MVGGEHRHHVGAMPLDELDVLVDGIGRAEKGSIGSVGEHDGCEPSRLLGQRRPCTLDVLQNRGWPVLCEHIDLLDAGIDEIAERDIASAPNALDACQEICLRDSARH